MNARFLASTGGRFAHAALSLAFLLMAYAAVSNGGPDALRWIALGTIAIIAGFIISAVLSVQDFHWYSLAMGVLVPMAGLYYFLALQLVIGRGAAIGATCATLAAFVFLAGIVIGLRPPLSSTAAGGRLGPAVPAKVGA
jgi:hypothetical protein